MTEQAAVTHVHNPVEQVSRLSPKQYGALLKSIPSGRVSQRSMSGKSFDYVEAWDVRRTLVRIFGFGGFSTEVKQVECVVDRKSEAVNKKGEPSKNWDVSYLVTMSLTIPQLGCVYTESAVGSAHLPDITQAHDMAVKTACSDALKRCAVNLGTQFGMSLYNGTNTDVVKATAVEPWGWGQPGTIETDVAADLIPQDEEVAPEARSDSEQPESPPESTPEASSADPTPPAGDDQRKVDDFLSVLRPHATSTNAAERIRAVAGLKAEVDAEFLNTVVTIQGQDITLDALCDKVVSGVLVPAEAAQ